jgi:hypothetical protein
MTTLHLRKSINRSPLRRGLLLIPLALALFALPQTIQAVTPAPDGGYPNHNTAEGDNALLSLTTGLNNTAVGFEALLSDTTGSGNTANGFQALALNTTGHDNTANGNSTLVFNTTGHDNTANGALALANNTTGSDNTANGSQALALNTTGHDNTADGFQALFNNTTGTQNTATGESALKNNTTASNNTGDGFQVLFHNTTGAGNAAIGYRALLNNNGSSNIALGFSAGGNLTTGSNNIDIGSLGAGGESNTIRIGSAQIRTFIKGISGAVVSGTAVVVNAGGQLGVAASSARFKEDIHSMDTASEAILCLKPVSFRYKKELDPEGIPQFGLVAEEVEKVNPDLVVRDADGKPYMVRYEAVNAMLLNEFLKEHRKVEEQHASITQLKSAVTRQEATITQQRKDFEAQTAQQQKEIQALTASLTEQAAQIQKVSAHLEASELAPRVVNNNQ